MANKKATVKKTMLDKNVERITKTAKTVNKEVTKTASKVVGNVLTDGKELQALATKTVKEAGKKIDLQKNVDLIRKTTNKVNEQVWKTAEVVAEDVTKAGSKAVKTAAQNAQKAFINFDLSEQVTNVQKTAKKVNEVVLETADDFVDEAFEAGQKWQDVGAKAMKGGLKLANRQQEIMFDTLEVVKGQVLQGADRFRKLFGKN